MTYFKQKKRREITQQQSLLSLRPVLNIKGVTFSRKCISLMCLAQELVFVFWLIYFVIHKK